MGNLSEPLHIGCTHPNPVYCKKCAFSHGESPFENAPVKSNCLMYPHNNGSGQLKPREVYFEGKECVFFEPAPPDQFRWTDDKSISPRMARWLEGVDDDEEIQH